MGIQSYKYGSSGIDGALEAYEMGMGMPGRTQYVAKAGGTLENWARSRYKGGAVKATITEAINELESGKGDKIFISAENHTQAVGLTVSTNICSIVGMGAPTLLNTRARIGHDAIVADLLTVSGYGNYFENLYLMHGMAGMSATATPATTVVSGNRNYFKRCHFGGPMDASLGDNAAYDTLNISGQENLFEDCVIGVDTADRSAANCAVRFASGSARNVFRRCLFVMSADNAGAFFINVASGTDRWELFQDCLFTCFSANALVPLTYAVSFNNGTASSLIFDQKTFFTGATDIVAVGNIARLWFGPSTNTANVAGLAINPAVT